MSTYATPTSTKTGKTTYHVSEQTDALRTGRRPVARDDSLYADFLRCAENLALLADHSRIDTADKDVDALQVLFELLKVVGHLPDADLDPRALQLLGAGLVNRGRADERCDTLQRVRHTEV